MADEEKITPHDLPVVRVKTADGQYKFINKSDYDPKLHEVIKGGEDQHNNTLHDGRNSSGTFSEPTPSDVRYPNKDATEYENNHGAFVGKSAAEMRAAAGMEDAPGGMYPAGTLRIESYGANQFRVMSSDREVITGVSKVEAESFKKMDDAAKVAWVKSKGGSPPEKKSKPGPTPDTQPPRRPQQ